METKTRVKTIAFTIHTTNEKYNYEERLSLIHNFLKTHKYSYCEILHDKDTNYTDIHTHILVRGLDRNLEDIATELDISVGYIERVDDYKAYYKYMLHQTEQAKEDNKHQYDEEEIKTYNDFKRPSYQKSNKKEYTLIDILNDIIDNDISTFKDLIKLYVSNEEIEKLNLSSRHYNLIKEYLR